MNGLPLRFCLVALQTLFPVDVFLKLNGVLRRYRERENGGEHQK
jgi:hypothetical protein